MENMLGSFVCASCSGAAQKNGSWNVLGIEYVHTTCTDCGVFSLYKAGSCTLTDADFEQLEQSLFSSTVSINDLLAVHRALELDNFLEIV